MWQFRSAPKIPGTNRVMPVEVTEARASEITANVPITRISDLTPLDRLGLPTFSAITPLAADLTSHLGKGPDAASARVSAIMEAVERVSAESFSGTTTRASYMDLRREATVIDPETFTLPDDTNYRADDCFTWAHSHDLMNDEPVWMVADLITNPPAEGILREVNTNGLAAGNTLLEAIVHGLCEVIERDAWSQHEFVVLFGDESSTHPPRRTIDPATLPDESGAWVERIHSSGFELVVHDITHDLGVATCHALLSDLHYVTPAGTGPMRFQGLGTHPNASVAVIRAITEAVQARLSFIQGARDDYNVAPASTRGWTRAQRSAQLTAQDRVSFSAIPSVKHDDVLQDLHHLIEKLQRSGFERLIVTDLTHPAFDIPVVRVKIPGLSEFVVNRRRVDWRCLRHLL
jgi:ribosomal protein S12 methylthiotransferase accessory factor